MKFYAIRDSYFSQIEASALVGLRFGFTCFGVAWWPPRKGRRPWWKPHFSAAFWSHSGQCDQRWIFRFEVGRKRIGYLTRGDATPDLWRYGLAGWSVRI